MIQLRLKRELYKFPKTRVCKECELELPLNNIFFHSNGSSNIPFHTRCKMCRNKDKREYSRTEERKRIDLEYRKNKNK